MAKLQPLLNHCKFFMKFVICTKFFVMHILQILVCAIMPGFCKLGHIL